MNAERIRKKLKRSGIRGLFTAALRQAASLIDNGWPNYLHHQLSAHRVLSGYTSFEGKEVLEVGGTQSCDSVYPFLKDGAASAVVTGLGHISQEQISKEYNLRILRADALKLSSVFEPCRFDIVYGLSIIEHIPSPKAFLDQVYTVLKPGGLAYFEGNPIWSSPEGHHLWVATWGGAYQNRATANYLFSEWPGAASTNPLPDWSHLLMTPEQMREYLTERSISGTDIDCIIDWVFCSDEVNRINMYKIAEAYTRSRLIVLEANTVRVDVPRDIQAALRKRCGDGIDYGISGVTYVLAKPQ
jgi:SAM-dependent methyltransferase